MKRKLLPFWDNRKSKVCMVVVHAVALPPLEAIKCFCQNKVSSHYLIAEDGEIWQLVGEKHRAWHAGVAKWRGCSDINSCSVGIELCSKDLGQSQFTQQQKKSLQFLLRRLIKKYGIKNENIVGHSDIAPTRKADPGKAFFWQELAAKGIGFWPNKADAKKIKEENIEKLLKIIGYDTTDLYAAAYAFCRRFWPKEVKLEKNVWQEDKILAGFDKRMLDDKEFIEVLQAVAYKYLMASKTPCNI